MPKLPIVSGKKVIRAFEKKGFVFMRQTDSHVILKHPDGKMATIPLHKEIKKGTLKNGILNPLRISVEEFIEMLRK